MTFPSCTTLELERDGDWLTVYEGREGIASFLEKRKPAWAVAPGGARS